MHEEVDSDEFERGVVGGLEGSERGVGVLGDSGGEKEGFGEGDFLDRKVGQFVSQKDILL